MVDRFPQNLPLIRSTVFEKQSFADDDGRRMPALTLAQLPLTQS